MIEEAPARLKIARGWTVAKPRTLKRYHIAELKSALQKYVRRSEFAKARAVAHEMMSRAGEDAKSAALRIPIIAGEEIGWPMIVESVKAWKAAEDFLKDGKKAKAAEVMVTLAGKMALAKKSGDTLALWGQVTGPAKPPKTVFGLSWKADLTKALLEDKDEEKAAQIAFWATKAAESRGQFWEVLGEAAATRDESLVKLVKASQWRLKYGIRGGDIAVFVMGPILGLCRFVAPEVEPEAPLKVDTESVRSLDWYAFDFHTWVGKRAVFELGRSRLDKCEGMKPAMIGSLQFYIESLRGKYDLPDDKWFNSVADWQLRKQVKIAGGREESEAIWSRLRPHLKELIEAELKQQRKL